MFLKAARWTGAALLALMVVTAPALAGDITDVRFGKHGDFSRVVIEADSPVAFTAFVTADPAARLVVYLPGAKWKVASLANGQGRGHGLFGTFSFNANGKPERLVFQLDKPSRVIKEMTLAPNGGGHRMVIDIAEAPEEEFVRVAGFPSQSRSVTELIVEKGVTPEFGSCARPMIVIDAGHGGKDPGALARFGGGHEADVNLSAALTLRELLLATGRFDVTMTRASDVFI